MHKFGVVVTAVAIRTADRTPVLLFCARQTWIKVFFFSKPQLLPGEGFWGGRISSARHEHPSSLWIEGIHIQQEGERGLLLEIPWLLLSLVPFVRMAAELGPSAGTV